MNIIECKFVLRICVAGNFYKQPDKPVSDKCFYL